MAELDYNSQIISNKNKINACNRTIRNLNDEIEELKVLKRKIELLRSSIHDAANQTVHKMNGLPGIFAAASTVLNIGFFSKILNAVKGPEFSRANNDLGESLSAIERKIKELNSQIDKNRRTINMCRKSINSLQIMQQENE